jgi:hypothetical protein
MSETETVQRLAPVRGTPYAMVLSGWEGIAFTERMLRAGGAAQRPAADAPRVPEKPEREPATP